MKWKKNRTFHILCCRVSLWYYRAWYVKSRTKIIFLVSCWGFCDKSFRIWISIVFIYMKHFMRKAGTSFRTDSTHLIHRAVSIRWWIEESNLICWLFSNFRLKISHRNSDEIFSKKQYQAWILKIRYCALPFRLVFSPVGLRGLNNWHLDRSAYSI